MLTLLARHGFEQRRTQCVYGLPRNCVYKYVFDYAAQQRFGGGKKSHQKRRESGHYGGERWRFWLLKDLAVVLVMCIFSTCEHWWILGNLGIFHQHPVFVPPKTRIKLVFGASPPLLVSSAVGNPACLMFAQKLVRLNWVWGLIELKTRFVWKKIAVYLLRYDRVWTQIEMDLLVFLDSLFRCQCNLFAQIQ